MAFAAAARGNSADSAIQAPASAKLRERRPSDAAELGGGGGNGAGRRVSIGPDDYPVSHRGPPRRAWPLDEPEPPTSTSEFDPETAAFLEKLAAQVGPLPPHLAMENGEASPQEVAEVLYRLRSTSI